MREDETILAEIMKGDTRAISNIYDHYFPAIKGFVLKSGGNHKDAEDVFQDAMVILFEKTRQKGFKIDHSLRGFFYTLCRNIWGNQLQKRSRKLTVSMHGADYRDESEIDEFILKEEENKLFQRSFRQLGDKCQQLLRLFFEKKKAKEIMVRMGFGSIGYTRKRKFLCQEKLIGLIKNDLQYHELKKD